MHIRYLSLTYTIHLQHVRSRQSCPYSILDQYTSFLAAVAHDTATESININTSGEDVEIMSDTVLDVYIHSHVTVPRL